MIRRLKQSRNMFLITTVAIFGFICFVIAGVSIYKVLGNRDAQPQLPTQNIWVNGQMLQVEVAKSADSQMRGLSFRSNLEYGHGMLFKYTSASSQKFWMRGMRFPLDIIFLRDGRVVNVAENVPASTGLIPAIVSSDGPTDEVLEVNAGSAKKMGIGVGTEVHESLGDIAL
jgi:hypothetical protein